ncbi:hypothetical protein YC2023_044628 [Brassica napus]
MAAVVSDLAAVYGTLFEADHRSTYWNFPPARCILRFLVDMRGVDIDQLMTESLRLYPQPPLLIRHTLKPETLNGMYEVAFIKIQEASEDTKVKRKVIKFQKGPISSFPSPYFWDNPQEFEPDRFLRTKESNGIEGWAGFDPSRSPGALYPNEIIADFQSLPFGGGPRKCIGEQFALMESTVALANVWNRLSLRI